MSSELAANDHAITVRTGLSDSDPAVLDTPRRDGLQAPIPLARRTRMGTTAMASVLRRLAHDGWVECRLSQANLRSFIIHATGANRPAKVFLPANQKLTALAEEWSESQVDRLIELLEDVTRVTRESAKQLPTKDRNDS